MPLLGLDIALGIGSALRSVGLNGPRFHSVIEGGGRLLAAIAVLGDFSSPLARLPGMIQPRNEVRRSMELRSNVPSGPIEQQWERQPRGIKPCNPPNNSKYRVIVVCWGLAGSSAGASLTELGTTISPLHMRSLHNGDTIVLEPWRATALPVIRELVFDSCTNRSDCEAARLKGMSANFMSETNADYFRAALEGA